VSSPFSFAHYSANTGLASNEITSIVQDGTGYLWIATNRGLQRFDGVQYKTFRHKAGQPTSLAENALQQLMIDRDDNLWILSNDGYLGIFNKSNYTYQPVVVKPRIKTSLHNEKRLISDEFNNIFLLFRGSELIQYDKKKNEFSAAANLIPLRAEWASLLCRTNPAHKNIGWVCKVGALRFIIIKPET